MHKEKRVIAVIDYGLGNLRSVSKAVESLGAKVEVTSDPKAIAKAKGAILPGVGAFYKGMENINSLGLSEPIKDFASSGKPFLGICLGLQLLFSESEEHGINKGLDIIKGKVKRLGEAEKIPHMGWNAVKFSGEATLFKNIPDNSYFYFVHSYFVEPEDKKIIAGTTLYSQKFTSAITRGNLFGTQFHPEKSSGLGLKILENFLRLCQKD